MKERNIPTNSLEANSIREGYELAIKSACEWFNEMDIESFKDLECDGSYYFCYGEFVERFKEALK